MKLIHLIEAISEGQSMDSAQASLLLHAILQGELNEAQIAAVLFGLQAKGTSPEELLGFSHTLMEICKKPPLPQHAIDLCGTGGDHKNTFNISTITSLLISSMGYPVIKHGNYGSTSVTGSSQIMELAGYQFTDNNEALLAQFEKFGYSYLHAPLFHTGLAKVGAIRKQLQMRTIFNLLGPLCNPINPTFRFHGTNSIAALHLYYQFFGAQKNKFAVYHSIDGHDEISLTSPFLYFTATSKRLVHPDMERIDFIQENEIKNPATTESSLANFNQVLDGKGNPSQNTVLAYNATLAISLFQGKEQNEIHPLYETCLEHIKSGGIRKHFNQIVAFQNNHVR